MCSDIVVQTRKVKSMLGNEVANKTVIKEEILRILPKYTDALIDN